MQEEGALVPGTGGNQEIQIIQPNNVPALTIKELKNRVTLVKQAKADVMQEGIHYGTIEGTKKPTLYKPGAEILFLLFRMAVVVEEKVIVELGNGHREYRYTLGAYSHDRRVFYGQGTGSCSTMEGKYRFRTGPKQLTDKAVPKKYWELRGTDPKAAAKLLADTVGRPGSYSTQKDEAGNTWFIAEGGANKVEHDNPADYWNTADKMGYKRAEVALALVTTGGSDDFTQDIEDMPEVIPGAQAVSAPAAESAPSAGQASTGQASGAGQASTPPPADNKADTGDSQPTGDSATIKQQEAIVNICKGLGYKDQADLFFKITDILQLEHTILSLGDLTKSQASAVIGALQAEQKKAQGNKG